MRSISGANLRARLEDAAEHAILDMRREGDFAQGHLFYATNIPRALLELRIDLLVPKQTTPIALVAADPAEAEDAGRVLASFGYTDVAMLEGGCAGWARAGGRLFSGVNVPSKAFGEFIEQEAGTPHIDARALKAMLDARADLIVLDARPLSEFRAMSIPGAIDCPGGELAWRAPALAPSPDTIIVVNCAGRTRSIIGAQSLIDSGIPNRVVALRDGTMGWHLAGFTLQHQKSRRAPIPDNASQVPVRAARLAAAAGVRTIAPAQIDTLRSGARTVYVFDVRDPEEYAQGHRAAAINAPGGQLIQTFDTLAAVRNAILIVTDREGARAPIVAAWLRQMGHQEVYSVIDLANDSTADGPPTPTADAIVARAPKIAIADARARLAADRAQVFDLANSKDYARAHIPSALWCERHALSERIAAARGDTVILTSPDGRLAAIAAADLVGTLALLGGTAAWRAARHDLETGRGNLPDQPGDVFYRPYDCAINRESAMQAYLDWEKDLVAQLAGEPGVAFRRVRL
jgi:rhodanese-related sulfurtransferase